MNVLQSCFIDFLHSQGIEEDYLDNWSEGSAIYYFGGIGGVQITFRHSCIPIEVAKRYLSLFDLSNHVQLLNRPECLCDW